jgi:hypothetical protein
MLSEISVSCMRTFDAWRYQITSSLFSSALNKNSLIRKQTNKRYDLCKETNSWQITTLLPIQTTTQYTPLS